MYQTISETITVAGVFKNSSFVPRKFKWNNKIYAIDEITSTHELQDGGVKKKRYAVISKGNLYLLEYHRQDEAWKLIQIWYEG
jgi:hypothetical protein